MTSESWAAGLVCFCIEDATVCHEPAQAFEWLYAADSACIPHELDNYEGVLAGQRMLVCNQTPASSATLFPCFTSGWSPSARVEQKLNE